MFNQNGVPQVPLNQFGGRLNMPGSVPNMQAMQHVPMPTPQIQRPAMPQVPNIQQLIQQRLPQGMPQMPQRSQMPQHVLPQQIAARLPQFQHMMQSHQAMPQLPVQGRPGMPAMPPQGQFQIQPVGQPRPMPPQGMPQGFAYTPNAQPGVMY